MFSAERFRDLRLRVGYTHQEMADLLGVNIRMIQRYESDGNPRSDILARMAETLNVSADYLLGLTDTPLPNIGERSIDDTERAALSAWRSGNKYEAIKVIVEDE